MVPILEIDYRLIDPTTITSVCMPMQRVEIFHRYVEEDKERLGLSKSQSDRRPATYITVHRGRILDDGYTQLSLLATNALKGTIRVKFVNEQVWD